MKTHHAWYLIPLAALLGPLLTGCAYETQEAPEVFWNCTDVPSAWCGASQSECAQNCGGVCEQVTQCVGPQ